MKPLTAALAFACMTISAIDSFAQNAPQTVDPIAGTLAQADAGVRLKLEKLPLVFNPNVGQANESVRFTSRGPGYSLYFTDSEAILVLPPGKDNKPKGAALRLAVSGDRRDASVAGMDALPGKTNYLIGNDPAKWHTGIAGYKKVAYKDVLPGIDLMYYGQGQQLEYDFRVSPKADPRKIQLGFTGGGWTARATSAGDLEIRSPEGSVRFTKPVAYQIAADGSRQLVAVSYAIRDGKRFGFRLGKYDHERELVIDPALAYSTYFGGSRDDFARGVAVDPQGNVYIAGFTASTDLPTTSGSLQPTNPAPHLGDYLTNTTGFVAKFDPTLSQLIYATYLGGSTPGSDQSGNPNNGADQVNAIAVDSNGNAYLTGATTSTDFPLMNAVQSTCGPAVSQDRFYCTTTSVSTCTPSGGSVPDAFVTKLDPTGANLVYSTYLGGSLNDVGSGIAVNAAGEAFVVGSTISKTGFDVCNICGHNNLPPAVATSIGFPTTSDAYLTTPVTLDASCNSAGPTALVYAFLVKMSATGTLAYSTYFGPGQPDNSTSSKITGASAVALDTTNNVYVTGNTADVAFPTTAGAAQTKQSGYYSAWAAKFNPANSGTAGLLYSTVITGTNSDTFGNGIAADQQGSAYVTGSTYASDFLTTPGSLQPNYPGIYSPQAFVTKLNPSGTQFLYSTYLGGSATYSMGNAIAVDSTGAAVVTGFTQNGFGFPLVNPLYTTAYASGYLVRMTPDGSGTSFSTYFGAYGDGTSVTGVVLDQSGNAYIAGYSNSIPTTASSYAPCPNLNNCSTVANGYLDAFVAKISGVGSSANLPPTARCQSVTVTAGPTCTAPASINNGSFDADGDAVTVSQSPAGPYGLGSTSVTLTVTDTASLSSQCTGTVTVIDHTPPAIACPSSKTVTANLGSSSATVTFPAPAATDNCSVASVGCAPPSGSSFPLGATTDTCTATDGTGNPATCQFTVTVQTPQQATQSIINSVNSLVSQGVLNAGQGNSLVTKLQQAITQLNSGKNTVAKNQLTAFISEVNSLVSTGVLTSSQAQPLISAANDVLAHIS